MTDAQGGFLARWSQRKVRAKSGGADVPGAPVPAPSEAAEASLADAGLRRPVDVRPPAQVQRPADAHPSPYVQPPSDVDQTADFQPPALPTMSDVSLLTRGSDYSRFVGSGVDPGVSNAAMKKLFSDPRYNVMDGLDTYIDDYRKPDPISLADLRLMNQAHTLGLFDAKDEEEPVTRTAIADPPAPVSTASGPPPEAITPDLTPEPNSDDDADLRLQQDDASRRPGAGPGARA